MTFVIIEGVTIVVENVCLVRACEDKDRGTKAELVTAGGPHYFLQTPAEITRILQEASDGKAAP